MKINLSGIKKYFIEMQKLCISQTGYCMDIADYIGHLESQEFRERFGLVITLPELLNLMIQEVDE